jgi:WD40 repeat protein
VVEDEQHRTIRAVSFSPCGNYFAAASFGSMVTIWSNNGRYRVATLEGHENEVKGVAWSVSGTYLATCSRDKSIWIWEVISEDHEFDCVCILQEHVQDVKAVTWHPHEDVIYTLTHLPLPLYSLMDICFFIYIVTCLCQL